MPERREIKTNPQRLPKKQRTSSEKASITDSVRETQNRLAEDVQRLLQKAPPKTSSYEPDSSTYEDLVIHLTDTHIGKIVKNDRGEEIFNTDESVKRINKIFDKALNLAELESAAHQYDAAHLLLGGDIVTGEGIFEGQAWEVDEAADEQISAAVEVFWTNIQKLANKFNYLQIAAVPGNHGEIRVNGSSRSANFDRILYNMLDVLVRESGLENVSVEIAPDENFINFDIRNHSAHMRHGENSLEHIGTSAGKNRWRGWLVDHDFDVGYRGHYHMFKVEPVKSTPIIMGGTICPPGSFEEKISVGSDPVALVHGASDSRPITFMYPISW